METADDLTMQEGGTSDLDRAKRVINKLQSRLERYQQTFEGCKVIKECDDGSLILESHTGERRHVWQGCDEKAQREIDKLRAEIERLRSERDEAIVRAKQAEQVIDSINGLRDRAYEEIKQERNDCAMLVKRLCHVVNATEPDNPVSRQALDYLDRKGLAGKPIR